MRTIVLDASAILALFFDEPGAETVESLLHAAAEADKPLLITAATWAEVFCQMHRRRGDEGAKAARHFESTMPLEVVPLDRDLAGVAAQLHLEYGLSLLRAFAAALSKSKKAELVTADVNLKPLEKQIKITWLTN
jgi:ribonuclease VapC